MKRLLTLTFALCFLATPAAAQDADLLGQCTTVTATATPAAPVPPEVNEQFQFLCGQVVNALTNVQPSFGIAFSGGAHTLGSSTTIGRRLGLFPRISVSARANVALADIPNLLDGFSSELNADGDVPAMGTLKLPVGSLQGDVVVGLLNGVSFGPAIGGVGSVDLLGSVSYVPIVEQIGLTQEIINAGIGARVGLLRQGLIMPGISVSGMYRTMLSDVAFGSVEPEGAGDPAEFTTDLSTLSLRAGISKGILLFDVNVGAGYDIYTSNVSFDWQLSCPAAQCVQDVTLDTEGIEGQLKTAAWNVHANLGLSLVVLNIVGEVGFQKTTELIDAAALSEAGFPTNVTDQEITSDVLDGGRLFASLGIRLTI